MVTPGMITP
jgi:hypothetical protein